MLNNPHLTQSFIAMSNLVDAFVRHLARWRSDRTLDGQFIPRRQRGLRRERRMEAHVFLATFGCSSLDRRQCRKLKRMAKIG